MTDAPNLFVTGPPRSGKTTALQRVRDRLAARGYDAGGLVCPARHENGDRVGFAVRDIGSDREATLAHVDRETGPTVGKYRVDVAGLDAVAGAAFERALDTSDYVLVDEVAPMQRHSEAFVEGVRGALDAEIPVVGAVHHESTAGFVGEVKAREDVVTLAVTPETRDELPRRIADTVAAALRE